MNVATRADSAISLEVVMLTVPEFSPVENCLYERHQFQGMVRFTDAAENDQRLLHQCGSRISTMAWYCCLCCIFHLTSLYDLFWKTQNQLQTISYTINCYVLLVMDCCLFAEKTIVRPLRQATDWMETFGLLVVNIPTMHGVIMMFRDSQDTNKDPLWSGFKHKHILFPRR